MSYACVVADPPWQHSDKLPGKKRGAAKNYAVMSVDDICSLARGPFTNTMKPSPLREVTAIALCGKKFRIADDALLFLWRLSSMPNEALSVVSAWGFIPKSEIVWVKTTGKNSASPPARNLDVPFVKGSDTSEAAAESMADSVEAARALVFECICSAGERGRTCDAIERRVGMLHQTASARVRDLSLMGKIIDSGQRRKTRSGRKAVVWIKAPPGTGRQPPAKVSSSITLHFGMGRYVRNCHETCIIAARGRATQLIENHSTRSVFFAPVPRDANGKIIHSAKPPEFYKIVEDLCGGPRLELFAREGRAGWTVAGDEIGVVKTKPRKRVDDLVGVDLSDVEGEGLARSTRHVIPNMREFQNWAKKKAELPVFEVWSEGFNATGGSGGAYFHGATRAASFKEACDDMFGDDGFYDRKRGTYWGCRLFDNVDDAKRRFG